MTVAASARAVHIVTTAGPAEGRGHLARSMAMTEALLDRGAEVSVELLRGRPSVAQAEHLRGLGVRTGDPARVDAVLVDLPDPDEVGGRWPADLLAVFDDRASFRGGAALIIQPSMDRWTGEARAERVLAGYEFAPIRASLQGLAASPPAHSGPDDVIVCFGGSDPADVSGRIAPVIAAAGPWNTTVILGADYDGRLADGAGDALGMAEATVVRDPTDLDRRLATAALVVAGAGTMKFELAMLGRPMVLLAVADDQLPVGPPFAATGAARYLGDGRRIEPEDAAAAVTSLMRDDRARAAMGRRGRSIVDGHGADRVATAVVDIASARDGPRRATA